MKNFFYIFLFISLIEFTSCKKFIDLKPRDQITNDVYWKSSNDLESYIIHLYPYFNGSEMISLDQNSDNMIVTVPDLVMNGARTLSTGNWTDEWSSIRDVNIFLENYQRCEDPFENYQQFVGEAYFFRAWFYFGLFKEYGPLPWINKPLDVKSLELQNGREPRHVIADSILADIQKAITYLPLRSVVGNSRLNKETALAFKSRVALYEGTWEKYHANTPFGDNNANPSMYFQEVIDASKELMNNTNYQVGIYSTGNPNKDYFNLFGMNDMSKVNEILFYKAFNDAEGLRNHAQYLGVRDPNGMGATWSLVSSYLGKDGNPINYLSLAGTTKGNNFLTEIGNIADPRLGQSYWLPGDLMCSISGAEYSKPPIDQGALLQTTTGFQIKKFANPNTLSACAGDAETQSETGFIYFRYAEVLLNYAEAMYELNNEVAYDALNLIRRRAGMPDFKVINQNNFFSKDDYGYQIADALYSIREERRVELAFEGFRESDFMRWSAANLFAGKRPKGYPFQQQEFPQFTPNLDDNGLIDFFQNRMPNGYGFRLDRDYLNPIPQDELTLNNDLTQNPGW